MNALIDEVLSARNDSTANYHTTCCMRAAACAQLDLWLEWCSLRDNRGYCYHDVYYSREIPKVPDEHKIYRIGR